MQRVTQDIQVYNSTPNRGDHFGVPRIYLIPVISSSLPFWGRHGRANKAVNRPPPANEKQHPGKGFSGKHKANPNGTRAIWGAGTGQAQSHTGTAPRCHLLYAAPIKTPFLYRVGKSRVSPGEYHGLSLQNSAQNRQQDLTENALRRLW